MENTRAKLLYSILRRHVLAGAIAALFFSVTADAQTTLFRFDATLPNAVTPATEVFQMQFKLFDAATGGTQIGTTNAVAAVDVRNRSFTVWLDFGAAAFPGADRYIEINYRRFNHESFTTLAMRERVLSVPYAIRSLTSGTADNALNLNGVPAADFVQTDDPRLSDDRNPLPGSEHYIQNTATQQSPANFNISGTGRANVLDATTHISLGGSRVLSNAGTDNIFVGVGAGANSANTFGNSFFGSSAGIDNQAGNGNSYFGHFAGRRSTAGGNSFFGNGAGTNNTTGEFNSFFGASSGQNNTTGSRNTFIGQGSGLASNTPQVNDSTAIGSNARVSTSNTVVLGMSSGKVHAPGNLLMGGGQLTAGNIIPSVAQSFSSATVSGIYTQNLVLDQFGLNNIDPSPIHLCIRSTNLGGGFGGQVLTRCSEPEVSASQAADFNKQQKQIEAQEKTIQTQRDQIKDLHRQIEAIRQLVCKVNALAEACK